MPGITDKTNLSPPQSGDAVPIDRAGADGHVLIGSAAGLDAPSSGNASSTQVVKGNDTRLSDSRTPTTHTHTLSQITDAGTAAASATGDFDAAGAAAAAQAAAEATAAAALSSHASDSTSIHGIADTSVLVVDSDLGTAAALDVPATGDAAVGEVVKGDDTRLTDARTPTSHNHAGEDVTSGTVAAARLGVMTGDSGAGGASGAVPAPAAGDAAASKFLKADGTWSAPGGGIGGSTGATDNAILRADGTGGATAQNSLATVNDSGHLNAVRYLLQSGEILQYSGSTLLFDAGFSSTDIKIFTRTAGKGIAVGEGSAPASAQATLHVFGDLLSQVLVEAHTTGDTLTAAESGSEHTNEGAGGEIELTLPSASAGLDFWFYVHTAQSLKLVAAAGDTIRTTTGVSSGGGYIRCATAGAWIHLRSVNGTEWTERGERGTWTIDS